MRLRKEKLAENHWALTCIVSVLARINFLVAMNHSRPKLCSDLAKLPLAWWRHQMETFSSLLAIYAGNHRSPMNFPPQRPVTRSFDIFFDLRLNKRLGKHSWGWWFETLSCPLWRQCNGVCIKNTSSRKLINTLILLIHTLIQTVSGQQVPEEIFEITGLIFHSSCTYSGYDTCVRSYMLKQLSCLHMIDVGKFVPT